MTRAERIKVMKTAAAVAAGNAFVPAPVRVALAALVEELEEMHARMDKLERQLGEKANG